VARWRVLGRSRRSRFEAILGECFLRLRLGVALGFGTRDERRAGRWNASPSSITSAPTNLPDVLFGVTSAYPTVVTVCIDHHMPSQMLEHS
jgi:hypothetical protein